MQHNCKALVINCMDFRLVDETRKYLKRKNLAGNYDLVCVAGSTKEIARPADELVRAYLLKCISVSYNLHKARKLIIIHHTDCGAYGGKKAFAGDWEEREAHVGDMEKSAEIIKEAFGEFEIKKVYAKILEEEIVFEEIGE